MDGTRIRTAALAATLTLLGVMAAVAQPATTSTLAPARAHTFAGTTTTAEAVPGEDTLPEVVARPVSLGRCPSDPGHALPTSLSRSCAERPALIHP